MEHPQPVQTIAPDDDDFSDLDAEIASTLAETAERKQLAERRKRLAALSKSTNPDKILEYTSLLAEFRKFEAAIVWQAVSATALFHRQHCLMCGSEHRFFMGWMEEQRHRTDATARRLIRGKPLEDLPERIEDHFMGDCEMCSDCAESVLLINKAVKGQL